MRSTIRRTSERLGWIAVALVLARVASAAQPVHWLERMNHALTTLNYEGTFAHWQNGRVELLRIVHRVRDGVVSERLVSLDGSGREFIRVGSRLTCYLPDKRIVLVERTPPRSSLLGGFPVINAEITRFYAIKEAARPIRIDARDTHLITVMPRDQYRYGYRLWIDDATAMPLKTQLCDARGQVIEQVVFASLKLPRHIPNSAFRPQLSTAGFKWLRDDARSTAAPGADAGLVWTAVRLPPGFHMAARTAQSLPGSPAPVDHLVFTDGLASVSVFVERGAPAIPAGTPLVETAHVGTSYAFATVIDGHKVTAVGEVPPQTVRFIADSVRAERVPYAPPPPQGGTFARPLQPPIH